jgi:hypothetical protein
MGIRFQEGESKRLEIIISQFTQNIDELHNLKKGE